MFSFLVVNSMPFLFFSSLPLTDRTLLYRMTGGAAYAADCTCPPGLTTSVKTGVAGSVRNAQTCNWYHRPGHFTGTLVRRFSILNT